MRDQYVKLSNFFSRLIEILIEISSTDWLISSMVCKLLMNYSEKSKNSTSSFYLNFEKNELILLQAVLTDLLGKKEVLTFITKFYLFFFPKDEKFAISKNENEVVKQDENELTNGNINEYIYYLWSEEFSPVASLLLKRVIDELEKL